MVDNNSNSSNSSSEDSSGFSFKDTSNSSLKGSSNDNAGEDLSVDTDLSDDSNTKASSKNNTEELIDKELTILSAVFFTHLKKSVLGKQIKRTNHAVNGKTTVEARERESAANAIENSLQPRRL